MIIVNHTI